jgi:hypothetical protein
MNRKCITTQNQSKQQKLLMVMLPQWRTTQPLLTSSDGYVCQGYLVFKTRLLAKAGWEAKLDLEGDSDDQKPISQVQLGLHPISIGLPLMFSPIPIALGQLSLLWASVSWGGLLFGTLIMVGSYRRSKIQLEPNSVRIDFHFGKMFREEILVDSIESLHFLQGTLGKAMGWGEFRIKLKNGVEVSMTLVRSPKVAIQLYHQQSIPFATVAAPEEPASAHRRHSGKKL